ncbi:MAG TPA: vWA domain-containing protein [Pyrinomonadaceae bacterium]
MAYTAQITRANPTLIVFLLDQSGSMADPFGGEAAGRKADFVAGAVNHALHDLVIRCTKTEEVRDYYHVAVVGYGRAVGTGLGGALGGLAVVPVSAVADNPARIESGYRRVPDGVGGFVEMPVRYPVWVHPHADGGTPMCRALGRVREIIEGWLGAHPRGFPPTVLHLTDGESSDGDPTQAGADVMSLGTDDGRVLLFNCHVSASRARKVEYPADDAHLPDGFARTLFHISSQLPENFLGAAQQLGVTAAPGSRGFVFNADPSSVVQFYEIGTSLTGMPPHIWMEG